MKKPGFACQTPGCGRRRTYEPVDGWLVVDSCEHCGDAEYSLKGVVRMEPKP